MEVLHHPRRGQAAVDWFRRIVGHVVAAGATPYLVPEIVPMYLRRLETLQFLEGLEELVEALNKASKKPR